MKVNAFTVMGLVILMLMFALVVQYFVHEPATETQDAQITAPQLPTQTDTNEDLWVEPASLDTLAHDSFEQAIYKALVEKATDFRAGEYAVEGHVVLEKVDSGAFETVYAVASWGNFGFENGIFTKISGMGATPVVLALTKSGTQDFYTDVTVTETVDDTNSQNDIHTLFPEHLHNEITDLAIASYDALLLQMQEDQAANYLASIGRLAEVNGSYIEKEPLDIGQLASTELLTIKTRRDAELQHFPFWIGVVEVLENGQRFLYETRQELNQDGLIEVQFEKKAAEGSTVKLYRFVIEQDQSISEYE